MVKDHLLEIVKNVFPTYGNHDSYPASFEDFRNGNEALNKTNDAFNVWFEDQATQKLFKEKGYYKKKVQLETKQPVYVIAINSFTGYEENVYLNSILSDPFDQLKIIEEELLKIENEKGLAIIIGHVPPNEMVSPWSLRFQALQERF